MWVCIYIYIISMNYTILINQQGLWFRLLSKKFCSRPSVCFILPKIRTAPGVVLLRQPPPTRRTGDDGGDGKHGIVIPTLHVDPPKKKIWNF